MENKLTYNLYSTERIYRDKTLLTYYFQANRNFIKKFSPIDINGERFRLDLESGELLNYKMSDIINSRNASLRRTSILIDMLLNMNDFYWFWTLTFDKEKIDRENEEEVFSCYRKYIKNIKEKYPSFRYMCFPEKHEDGCFHFHLITGGLTIKQMGLVNSGKVCCSWATHKNGVASRDYYEKTKDLFNHKETDGEPIYNLTSFAYGLTTVSRIVSRERCNSYVKKYVKKDLGKTTCKFKKRFYYSANLNVPEVVKRLVGADFDSPQDIGSMDELLNSPLVKNANGQPYISDYNTLQVMIDNDVKELSKCGFIKLSGSDTSEVDKLFAKQSIIGQEGECND